MITHYQIYFDMFQLTFEVLEPKDQEVLPGLISPGCIFIVESKHIQLMSHVLAAHLPFRKPEINKNSTTQTNKPTQHTYCMETFRSSPVNL